MAIDLDRKPFDQVLAELWATLNDLDAGPAEDRAQVDMELRSVVFARKRRRKQDQSSSAEPA